MGKKSRQKMGAPTGDRKPGWLSQKWQGAKDKVNDHVQGALDKAQAKAIEHYTPRFCQLSGCNHPNMIHWDDPQISLECKLCDIRNLKLIRNGKHRDQFLEYLTDEERDLYLNFTGNGGVKYTDLEDGALLIEMVRGIKQRWKESRKKNKGDDLTPEEEQAVIDALDSFVSEDEN